MRKYLQFGLFEATFSGSPYNKQKYRNAAASNWYMFSDLPKISRIINLYQSISKETAEGRIWIPDFSAWLIAQN